MQESGTLEEFLEQVGRGQDNAFGRRFRNQFRDGKGTAELAMLAAPSATEFEDFRRAVAAMTAKEKQHPEELDDQQIQEIAERCGADCGNVGIFLNGFILARQQAAACPRANNKET